MTKIPRGGPRRPLGPEPIGDILRRVLVEERARERAREGGLCDQWRRIVGPEIAAHARPGKIRKGVLTVEVDSPSLLAELSTYCRDALLESLRSETAFRGIRVLRFRLAGCVAEQGGGG